MLFEKVWESVRPRTEVAILEGHPVLVGVGQKTVRVWDPATGALEQDAPCGEQTRWLGRVALDDRPVLAGSSNKQGVRIWDPQSATWQPAGVRSGTYALMLERRALVADADKAGTIRVQDLLTGETLYDLHGHTGYWITGISTVTVSGTTYLATAGGADRTVRLWNAANGECELAIPVHHEVIDCTDAGAGLLAVAVPAGVLTFRVTA